MHSLLRAARAAAFVLVALSASPSYAQESQWLLGHPALAVHLPGEPRPGGVPWSTGASVLPTSWSTEGGGLRVEVAYLSRAGDWDAEKEIARILPGAAGLQRLTLSGYPAW